MLVKNKYFSLIVFNCFIKSTYEVLADWDLCSHLGCTHLSNRTSGNDTMQLLLGA